MMIQKSVLLLLLFATYILHAQQGKITINATENIKISRHIYGHFSEHLGRCVYDGFWVAPGMNVPKKDRIRPDVVEALKK